MSNERKPHKHAEVIKAWADGVVVQSRLPGRDWEDCGPVPPDVEYRVKPEPAKVRYRVAICKYGPEFYAEIARNDEGARQLEANGEFVRWLTGWNEYEFPQ